MAFGFVFYFYELNKSSNLRKSFLLGLAFGFGYFLVSLHWIIFPLFFDKKHFLLIPFVLIFSPLFLGIFFALPSLLIIYLKENFLVLKEKIFISSFVASIIIFSFELLRSFIFGGFPWNLFGHIWEISHYFTIISRFIGVFGLSFLTIFWLVILSNYFIKNEIKKTILIFFAFPIFLLISGKFLELEKSDQTIKVRLVQPNIPQKLKWSRPHQKKHIEKLLQLSFKDSSDDYFPDLIVWPEVAIPFFLDENKRLREYISEKIPAESSIVLGALSKDYEKGIEKIFNSLFLLSHNNDYKIYNKKRLVPFGEYIPLRDFIPFEKITYGVKDFSSGEVRKNIIVKTQLRDLKFEPSICYEGIFSKKDLIHDRPSFLLNITNDAWFGITSGPWQHLSMTRFRSIERGLPLIRVANSGISAVFDQNGKKMKSMSLNTEGFIDFDLDINNSISHYSKFGLWSILHLIILLVLFSIFFDNFNLIKNKVMDLRKGKI